MIDIQIQDHRKSCIGEREEAKEAYSQEDDGGALRGMVGETSK